MRKTIKIHLDNGDHFQAQMSTDEYRSLLSGFRRSQVGGPKVITLFAHNGDFTINFNRVTHIENGH